MALTLKMQLIAVLATLLHLQLCSTIMLHPKTTLAFTKYGEIRGRNRLSANGRSYQSFTNIPYAKPPVGELRFKAPQKPDPWNNTRDATEEPPVCIQRNYLFSSNPSIEGQEDCLYLNVFAPNTKIQHNLSIQNKLLPVMVFLHWGAFIAGASTTGYLGPELFMDKDVVLVTFNYRLGPFGFLTTTDDAAPGNYGLKDQVAAFQWVQENIGHFGGDKNNVTIFGQSAGAGSVHYHMLSSASEGLFHRAISQSGNALAGWAMPLNSIQQKVTLLQASFVGCDNHTENEDMIKCLRSVPAERILKTQDYFRVFNGNPLAIFGSVVETRSDKNPNPFLTQTPLQYILQGEIKKVPWLTGVVKNEGVLRAASLIRPQAIREQLNANFEKLVSETLLLLSLSAADPKSLYQNITKFYLGEKQFVNESDDQSVEGFINVYTDRAFFYPLYQSIILHSRKGHSPIYLYNFEYQGQHSYGDMFAYTEENIDYDWGTFTLSSPASADFTIAGVCHCDDLLYLFNSPSLLPKLEKEADILMSRILVDLWTNFAKYGNPNPPENLVHANLRWQPLNLSSVESDIDGFNDKVELLNITGDCLTGPKLEIDKGFYKERMKFWTDSDIFENIGLK